MARYRVYRHEIDEKNKTLDLWVRRKRGNRKECSSCGPQVSATPMTSVNGLCVTCHEGSDGQLSAEVDGSTAVAAPALVPETRRYVAQAPSPTIAGPKYGFGVVEAINGNIRMPINRGRGYKNIRYLLLKANRMAVTNTQNTSLFQKITKAA